MSFSQPHMQSTSPMDANGVVRCTHGEAAVIKTSQTPKNPNREFYACSRSIQSERCKFFFWVDDPIFSRPQNIPVPHPASAPAPSRPPPSQRQRAESARALGTPQKSPRKRIADIEAALNSLEPQTPSTPPQSSPQQNVTATNGRTSSFLFGSQSSQASTNGDWEEILTEVDQEQSGSSRSTDQSFGSLDPRTPKKLRFTPVEQQSDVQVPLTPPQTIRRRADGSSGQGIFYTDFPQTPIRNKGKERENSGGEQTTSGVNAPVPGPSESGRSTLERATNAPARTPNTLQRTSSNPFIVDQTVGESIASHLESLVALQSPDYIRKMEKKVNALEQSNKVKAKYLDDLRAAKADAESGNARLTEENAGLARENARLTQAGEQLMQANADLQERLRQSEHSSRVKDIEIAAIKSRRPPNM
ncbi:hypothetical protein EDB19DRAFT_1691212 [Suillus lakei]|nr:hypothetical protein EDB19DRAFT_1691212 [Suillus lakei]